MITVHPGAAARRRMVRTAIGFGITPVIGSLFTGGNILVGLFVAAVVVPPYLLAVGFFVRRAYLTVTPDDVRKRTLLGRERIYQRSDDQCLVDAHAVQGSSQSRSSRHLALLDEDGFAVVRIRAAHWDDDDLGDFTSAFGDQLVEVDEVVTPNQLSVAFPYALPFGMRRPWVVVGIIMGVGAVLVVALVNFLEPNARW